MAKKIQLSIAEPCHENWDGMTPVDKGKFCGSCQKQVVDFSDMSDRQVAEFFKKPSTGSVCGRFMTDQLDRPMEIPRKRIPWLKYFFQIAIPAFLVSIKASAQRTQGEIRVNTVTNGNKNIRKMMGMVSRPRTVPVITGDTILTPIKNPEIITKGEIAVKEPECIQPLMGGITAYDPEETVINKNEISGTVVDEKGQPIPFASIESGKKGYGVTADENGVFTIKTNFPGTDHALHISSTGFDTKKIIADTKNTNKKITVELKKANLVLPEVVLTTYGSITVGYVVCSSVTTVKTIVNKNPLEAENSLFVYPNPAVSGSSINISFKNPEEGYYQLRLLSQSGQVIRQQEVWIDAEARLMNTEIPTVAAGSYFIVLSNKKTGKEFTQKLIIQ